MNDKKFGGRRRRGGMRFRPSGGAGHRSRQKEQEAREARAEILVSDTTEEEKVYNERRHEKEIVRSENVAAGLPPEGDATQAQLEQSKDDAVEGGYRRPHLDVPAEVQEELADDDEAGDNHESAPAAPAPAGDSGFTSVMMRPPSSFWKVMPM